MRKLLLIAIFVLALSAASFAQETCNRHVETAAKYSLCIPPGWTAEAVDGEPFKFFFGPDSKVFRSNINVRVSTDTSALETSADQILKAVLEMKMEGLSNLKLIKRGEFSSSGGKGYRFSYSSEYMGLKMVSVQYLFSTETGKIVLTGTTTEEERAAVEKIFDTAIGTLQLIK